MGHQHYEGEARLKSGEVFYTEYHDLDLTNGQLTHAKTIYKDGNAKLIAELDSDFLKSKLLPDCQFLDHRDLYEYKLRLNVVEHTIQMSHRDSPKENWKEKNVKVEGQAMVLQGALSFIQDNMDELKSGKTQTVQIATPSRLDVSEVLLIPEMDVTKDRLTVTIKPKSQFLRLVFPESKLIFEIAKRRLLEFHGISNLLDEKEKSQYVDIKYKY